ncbi:hypothetical protein [Aureimonas mangrovi]|uniref:hypothetical protein n=1 Tax=Aureimonas mangrovi TaxID=2758041 RepID=UPI00163D803D|nr:hypothetical protein [Aureimonas mangrovi]
MLTVPPASQTASAESPRLGPFEYPQPRELRTTERTETFDAYEALHGSVGSPEYCGPGTGRLWVVVGCEGECIRYYHHGLAPENPVALVYFGGEMMLRTQKSALHLALVSGSVAHQKVTNF